MSFWQTTRRIILTPSTSSQPGRSPTGVTSLWTATNNNRPNFKPPPISTSKPYGPLRFLRHPANQTRTKMGNNSAPEEAPFPLTEVDKWVLSQTDDEYTCHTWDDLRKIIANNELDVLKRKPSDLRRYMKWTAETKAEYGNMTAYLLAHRLPKIWGSPPFHPVSPIPFENPADYRVLINDWPYGLEPGITHIVVWTRAPIETDSDKGDMTPESRRRVAAFVKRYFVDRLGPGGEDRVLWFKNWVALQSVPALEHIHVLVRDVEPSVIEEWTREEEWHRA
ncbi:hypothetical protein QBC39DRAFT_350769 [Podospora conica]|nr:hypothetical protein QBC39DRAFT_350769 [Schizothecium conicum]